MLPDLFRRTPAGALLAAVLCGSLLGTAIAAEQMVDFVVVRTDTLIGLSNSVLTSPAAWHEVAKLNHVANANMILPGQHLRIPVRLLRWDAVSATLVSVTGPQVQAGGAAAQVGAHLAEGQSVQTGPGSSAVLALADGSRVQVPPSSLAQVTASRRYGGRLPANAVATAEEASSGSAPDSWFAGTLRVLRGSVQVFATKVLRAKPLEVVTPTAVVGVRGTEYRVALDADGDNRTHAEVLEGRVHVEAGAGSVELPAGFGTAVDTGQLPTATALLPPPDLTALPARFERPIVHFSLVPGDGPLRVQVAADPNFDQIVSDQHVAAGAELRLPGLEDAQWYLRARRIDGAGIEGLDTVRPFVLKARPEPPAYLTPRRTAKLSVGAVDFSWAMNAEAPRVHLQVAHDEAFQDLVDDRDDLDADELNIEFTQPGTYHWRLASVRANGDHGPFGDPQGFELRALPEPPGVIRSADGNSLVFAWGGRPDDRQQVEFASDPGFTHILAKDELGGTQWTLPLPTSGGRYYFRYRTVEPDGFVSAYSATLMVNIPRDWSGLGLLLPFLLLL